MQVILFYISTVNGDWSEWTEWSACNKPCNAGRLRRWRFCNNPIPMYNGKSCQSNDTESEVCNLHKCQGKSLL